jgi:hypothetical protein
MKITKYQSRINDLISIANKTITARDRKDDKYDYDVYVGYLNELWTGGASFLEKVFGKEHVIYKSFESCFNARESPHQAKGALNAAKAEIDGGWLFDLRGIVSAEIFNDFFEMAAHLLSEGYKDPAAVMIGSTLEEHLRQLCTKHNIPLETSNPNKPSVTTPKKAEVMNADLVKAQVYNLLDQKQVTAWLGLRNSAAHGKYADYTKEQVDAMHYGVMNFITRTT